MLTTILLTEGERLVMQKRIDMQITHMQITHMFAVFFLFKTFFQSAVQGFSKAEWYFYQKKSLM